MFGGFLLAEDGREAADLGAEGGAHVLGGVGDELFDRGHDVAEEGGLVDELAEACACQSSVSISGVCSRSAGIAHLVFGRQWHSEPRPRCPSTVSRKPARDLGR